MADRIKKIIDNYRYEQSWKKKAGITLMILSLFVVTSVFWSLKLNGIAMSGDAFCGLEEHKHSDECYEKTLICSLEENDEHKHNDECYNKQLICDKDEHTHTLLCYSDINADKEDQTKWEASLPKLSNHWSNDLITVAKSQLGYQESERNFILAEDNQTRRGYTRYGAWYGNEYGDWNGMFLAFCMNYANLSQDMIPITSSYQTIADSLTKQELFETKDYNPNPGDIVFLNNQRVAIVIEVNDSLHVIEGDVDNEVKEVTYAFNDESICGYGNIQKAEDLYLQMNISSLKAIIYTDQTYKQIADDQTMITVTGILPENASVKAYPVHTSIQNFETVVSYDISIILADGTVYEPKDQTIKVQITLPEKETEKLSVYHIPDSSQPEEIKANITNTDITFETTHFSVYAVVKVPRVLASSEAVSDFTTLRNKLESNNQGAVVHLNNDITAIATGTINIGSGSHTLDLNGYTLNAPSNGSLFNVGNNAELTIVDSGQQSESTEEVPTNSNVTKDDILKRMATFNENSLTYYVTETQVVENSVIGATEEKLMKHTVVLCGNIKACNQPVISMSGGTVNIESGMIHGGTNRAVNMTGGTLNLNGGYIFGFNKTGGVNTGEQNFGGAILASGGALNISGTVVAGNTALNGGAIYAKGSTTVPVTVSGGIISGNISTRSGGWDDHSESSAYRCGGGAFFMNGNSTLTMNGGYITNNLASDDGYFDGGGGIFLSGNSSMIMNNGFITGNQAQGGGGVRTDFGKNARFTMNDGFVSGNIATTAEGGGVTIDRNGVGSFDRGYITNNRILNTVHWGGGGLFCADGSDLFLKKALITENDAGGFGGGVAGCPTGKIYLYIDDGCAIYNNKDIVDGDIHFVNGGAKDGIDAERCNDFFQSQGHKDYFCALNSTVTGTMLGNYSANWQGSADGTAVSLGANDAQTATSVMGLESHPTQEGINAAQSNASVYINGNYSYTHGGGILCNGNLIIGKPTDIKIPARLGLNATKVFLDGSGNNISNLDKYNFQFEIFDNNNQVVSTGTCDENGKIIFENLEFNKEGTYTYTIKEQVDDSKPSINYDTTEYRLTVTVEKKVTTLYEATKTAYLITSTKIEKSNGKGNWETVSDVKYQIGKDNLALELSQSDTFVNTTVDVSKITVIKKWAENIIGASNVTVDLYQDGKVYATVVLNEENKWTHTWTNLPVGHSYHVEEREVKGYIASYTTSNPQVQRKDFWVPATSLVTGKQYMIVSNDGTQALYITPNHQNHGFDATDKKEVVQIKGTLTIGGQTYSNWYDPKLIDSRCTFTAQTASKNGNSGIILKNEGASVNTWILVQNADGNYLKSTSGSNYASFMSFENGLLKSQVDYNWNPNNLRTVIYDDTKFNTSTDSNKAVKLYTLVSGSKSEGSIITITNTPEEEYELPETGGNGTEIFAMIGLLLMLTPLVYKFKFEKRTKEE